jgi:hypothetical protein
MPRESQIQLRRDTAANWTSTNPTLAAGEWGLETDTGLTKLGDGATVWSSLNYFQITNLLAYEHQPTDGIDTISRSVRAFGSNGTTSGAIFLTYFTPLRTVTVSEITMRTASPAASGLTLARMGLYSVDPNGDATLVARTASDTTLFAATFTTYTRSFSTADSFPATYTLAAGQRYASAFVTTGTTMPALVSVPGNGAINALPPRAGGGITSQTDLLTTYTDSSVVTSAASFWARLT